MHNEASQIRDTDIDTPQKIQYHKPRAEVVKSVDTQRSGRCARKGMGVRVPPSAPHSVSGKVRSGLRRLNIRKIRLYTATVQQPIENIL